MKQKSNSKASMECVCEILNIGVSSVSTDMNVRELLSQFPMCTEQELLDYKLRFQMLDLNADGLLDENEMLGVDVHYELVKQRMLLL